MASCSSVERVIVTRRGSPKENGGHHQGERHPGQVPGRAGRGRGGEVLRGGVLLNQRVRWLIRATCVGLLLLIPQLAWASQHTADPAVRVSDGSPFAGSCGLAGQMGKNVRNSEVEPFVDVNPADTTNMIGEIGRASCRERV